MLAGDALKAELLRIDSMHYFRSEKWCAGPWSLAASGREWVMATDGHVMVAVCRDLVPGEFAQVPDGAMRLAQEWIGRTPSPATVIDAEQLLAFVGVDAEPKVCETCHGTLRVTCRECKGKWTAHCECSCGHKHKAECGECDGEKTVPCLTCVGDDQPKRPMNFVGAVVDGNLLASALRAIRPTHQIEAASMSLSKGGNVVLVTPREAYPMWMTLVMPLTPGSKAKESFYPRFFAAV